MLKTFRSSTIFQLWRQTGPIYISGLAGIISATMDSSMLGHYSPDSLQTMSIAFSIYMTIYLGLFGVLSALIPICAQQFGKQNYAQISHSVAQGFWLAIFLSLIACLALLVPDPFLSLSAGQIPSKVEHEIRAYLAINILTIPAVLCFRVLYCLCAAMQRANLVMRISIYGVVLKGLLNYFTIFVLNLGSSGAALSTAIVSWVTLIISFYAVRKDAFFSKIQWIETKPQFKSMLSILKLGLPMGGSYLIEIFSFSMMALLAAREGTFVSGAHQIMANFVAILFMFPSSLGLTATAIVGKHIGAQNIPMAKHTVKRALQLGMGVALIVSITVLITRSWIVAVYTDTPQTTQYALGLFTLLPLFHLCDSLQGLNINILRAYKVVNFPFFLQTCLLLCFGFVGGWFFGYGPAKGFLDPLAYYLVPNAPTGLSSLWIMCGASMGSCGFILFLWLLRLTRKNNLH